MTITVHTAFKSDTLKKLKINLRYLAFIINATQKEQYHSGINFLEDTEFIIYKIYDSLCLFSENETQKRAVTFHTLWFQTHNNYIFIVILFDEYKKKDYLYTAVPNAWKSYKFACSNNMFWDFW